ncbi:hypothetical protein M2368_003112 [Arthrobacter sp. JUb119]|nr:hypothetical protein [Arthrobacter sp. JUb119]
MIPTGTNEKHAATYHGGEYTPSTEAVRSAFSHHRDAGMEAYNTGLFDRCLETVRAEAKAEALREAADQTPVHWDFPPHASALQIRPWLRDRANQYQEKK